jgi:chromosome partitioning protein
MAARVFVVLNKKGGVGKTSTCFHLAGHYAKAGRRVLLIDMDPQANLTEGFIGGERAGTPVPRERSVTAIFADDLHVADPSSLIVQTPFPGVMILPGSQTLEYECERDPADDPRQHALRDLVQEVRGDHDIILVDCPPNTLLGSWSALVAGDGVIVPIQVEDFGAQGLKQLAGTLNRVRKTANPRLALLGYLITMYQKRLALHQNYAETLRAAYKDAVFRAEVPFLTDYKIAVTAQTPVGNYKPRSQAARAIADLADEILERDAAGAGSEQKNREVA